MPGLLDFYSDPNQVGLLATAAGLLRAGGPSPAPVGLGSALGQGLLTGLGAAQQAQQLQQTGALRNLQAQNLQLSLENAKRQQAAIDQYANQLTPDKRGLFLANPQAFIKTQTENPFAKVNPTDYTQESVQKFTLTKNPADLVPVRKMEVAPSGEAYNPYAIQPGTIFNDPNKLMNMGPGGPVVNQPLLNAKKEIATATRPKIDVSVPVNLAENKYAATVGTKAGERDISQFDVAQSAVDNVAKLDMVVNHLKNSEAITGIGADVLLNVQRARQLISEDKARGKQITDTQLLDAFLGSDVFPMIKELGIGARGLDTPAEREFLRQVMTGSISMNKDTLIKMTEMRRDIAKRAIDRFNKRVRSGELNKFFEYQGMTPHEIEMPQPSDTGTGQQKIRRYNPATGRIE